MTHRTNLLLLILLGWSPVTGMAQSPLIVAHRGASHDAPENTLPAFRLAWEKGSDAIEGDFHLTRDQKVVCIHDRSTGKYCRENLVVKKSTLEELKKLDVGSYKDLKYAGTRVPTLDEVLGTVPAGKKIYIEVKCGPEIIPFLKRSISESGLHADQVIIIAFDRNVIQRTKKSLPGHKAFWLTSFRKTGGQTSPGTQEALEILHRIRADGLSTSSNGLTQGYLKSIRDAGFEHHVWTVNDPAQARKMKNWGTQSITTDRPALIRKALLPKNHP